ncbi:hypothetical protein HY251_18310, partial [bacterium]|nr:hypothetical protein [bacterium]
MAVSSVLSGRIAGSLPDSVSLLGIALDPRQQIFLATSISRVGCLVFFLAFVKEPHGKPIRAIVAAVSSYAKARISQMKLMPGD